MWNEDADMGHVIEGALTGLDREMLFRCVEVAHKAMLAGNHPFGAIVADPSGRIIASFGNDRKDSPAMHAETKTLLEAGRVASLQTLSSCTLYTTFEPCVMCAGCMYWTGVGRLVYGLDEAKLLALTGDNPENPTFTLDSRTVFRHGQRTITVVGPVADPELETAILKDHLDFWKK